MISGRALRDNVFDSVIAQVSPYVSMHEKCDITPLVLDVLIRFLTRSNVSYAFRVSELTLYFSWEGFLRTSISSSASRFAAFSMSRIIPAVQCVDLGKDVFASRIRTIVRPLDADLSSCFGGAQCGLDLSLGRRPVVTSTTALQSFMMRARLPAEPIDKISRPAYITYTIERPICENRQVAEIKLRSTSH